MPRLIAKDKTSFIKQMKYIGLLKNKHRAAGRLVIDRVGNDQEFANLVDAYCAELPKSAENWTLSYRDGGQ